MELQVVNLINNHYNKIEKYFKSKIMSKFIIYNIDYDNINKLNKYINTKNNKFPHINSSQKRKKEKLIIFISIISIIIFIIYLNYSYSYSLNLKFLN